MPFAFTCPHCGKTMQAPDHLAGKKQNCPMCRKPLMVPDPRAGGGSSDASVGAMFEEELASQSARRAAPQDTGKGTTDALATYDARAKRVAAGDGVAPHRALTIIIVSIFGGIMSLGVSPLFVFATYQFFTGDTPVSRIVGIMAGAFTWLLAVYFTMPGLLMGRRDLYEMSEFRMQESGRPGVWIGISIGLVALFIQLIIGLILAVVVSINEYSHAMF